jgi:hypothetical protein
MAVLFYPVLLKCGEPMLQDSFCKPNPVVNNVNECETIEMQLMGCALISTF